MAVRVAKPLLIGLWILSCSACAPYRAGSFQSSGQGFPSTRTTRGCLDLALSAATDPAAEGPVVDLYLGNRCTEAVWVDIPGLEMTAYLADGQEMPVTFYDPRNELKPAVLGGKELAMERLELNAPIETLRVCAQLDDLASSRGHDGPPQQLCVEVEGGA